ncbi:MAG: CopG family ribbon-helix-helix protein [Burkholderiales bacterium]
MTVSLRIPDEVKRRVEKQAGAGDTTPHAFMLEAIKEKLVIEEAKASFHAEAYRRLARMKKSGKSIPAGEVFDYLRDLARGAKAARPKARRTP